jgi:hypothetical protein
MRIWDIEPKYLCRQHLLAEHRELHGLWNILTKHGGVGGYARHPETLRWVGKQAALFRRHEREVEEFARRGFRHLTPLDPGLATGSVRQQKYIDTPKQQLEILKNKPCACKLNICKPITGINL